MPGEDVLNRECPNLSARNTCRRSLAAGKCRRHLWLQPSNILGSGPWPVGSRLTRA